MKKLLLLNILSLCLLSACSHYSRDLSSLDRKINAPASVPQQNFASAAPQDIAPAAGVSAQGALAESLTREFYTLARAENDKAFDYKAAKNYTKMAMAASSGKPPAPSPLSAYDLPKERAGELAAARAELMTALQSFDSPENASTLAMAQGRYECWLEKAEEAAEETHFAQCRDDFHQAMAALIAPTAGEGTGTSYDIAFIKDSGVIAPESEDEVAVVAQFLNAPENAAYIAEISGQTAQAQALIAELSAKGIGIDRIQTAPGNHEAKSAKIRLVPPQPKVVELAPVPVQEVSPSAAPVAEKTAPVQKPVMKAAPPAAKPVPKKREMTINN
jgi:hypothetical protein